MHFRINRTSFIYGATFAIFANARLLSVGIADFEKSGEFPERTVVREDNESTHFSKDGSSKSEESKYHFDMVRPGCSLYGINPTPYMKNPMQNVVYLTSKILQIRHIDRDSTVGYGAEGFAKKGSTLATIAFGYADGCMRSVSGRGFCAIDGVKFPVVGRVSMDLIVIDITKCKKKVTVGDEVEIIGNVVTVDDFANFAGTIGYEIITRLGSRVTRVY